MKWVFLAMSLLAATPLAGQGYGQSLAVGDGEVLVGESLSEASPGYVYVYRKDSGGAWTEVQRIEASNSADGDHFGRTVTISADQLLVGSTILQTIFVFEKDASGLWRETQTLTASDNVAGNYIGRISAAEGDHFFTASWANSDGRVGGERRMVPRRSRWRLVRTSGRMARGRVKRLWWGDRRASRAGGDKDDARGQHPQRDTPRVAYIYSGISIATCDVIVRSRFARVLVRSRFARDDH